MRRAGLLVVALALAGCNGGTVDRHALTNDAATIDSINCEAWLLARAVSRDRVTAYYTREQAEELGLQAAEPRGCPCAKPGLRRASSRAYGRSLERRIDARRTADAVSTTGLLIASSARKLADTFKRAGAAREAGCSISRWASSPRSADSSTSATSSSTRPPAQHSATS